MIHVLIEENYSSNNRIKLIFDGMNSVLKKKRLSFEIFKSLSDIKGQPRVVILICASLKWTTDAIKALSARGIHPLVFGFQYLDTMYQYSCINLTYTKTTYLLTGYLLSENVGEVAVIGYNSDSMPDRLKLAGAKHAAERYGVPVKVFKNNGDVIACINDFAQNCGNVKNIVCLNDIFAVIMSNCYPELLQNKRVCSCNGTKISEYAESPYPSGNISYYKAGGQIAELYLFLMRLDDIYSTVLTLEMDIVPGKRYSGNFPLIESSYSRSGIDFYGDKTVAEVELINRMLLMIDEIDEQILHDIMAGDSYEVIAENRHLALNTVKYRVHAMVKNADVAGRKELVSLIEKYNLKLSDNRHCRH